jgi:hypothetical protein
MGLALVASGSSAFGAGGQIPGKAAAAPEPPKLAPYIYGARQCQGCHDQQSRPTYKPEELERWICRMDEFRAFDTKDKHKLAFKGLAGPRGEQMSKLLGTDVTKIEACLNCHSTRERGAESQSYSRETDGVTCVSCHGTYAEWVERHQRAGKDWRDLDRQDKELRFGMTDLWNPVRRAETCASCHVGNFARGRVITHAMYAAGHPPLGGFELATYGDAQPRHWQYLREKTPERLRRLNRPGPHNLEQTQLAAVGAMVVLREWMTSFASEASAAKPDPIGAQWPDFARFDCYACHHELEAKAGASWRQLRHSDGQPGRPTAPAWPMILIQLGIDAAKPEQVATRGAEFQQHRADFHQGMKLRPFGDLQRLVPAARNTSAWASSVLESLNQTSMTAEQASQMLVSLCKNVRESTPDYDSARQIAWAFRVIYRESVAREKRDPAIERALDELGVSLALDLAPGANHAPLKSALLVRLRKSAEFDPRSFQSHFATIAERLQKRGHG